MRATQTRAKHTKEIGLAKGNDGIYLDLTTADRYRDYATYAQGITAAHPEHFMAQDLAKWTNQDFAVSIYNMVNDAPDDPKVDESNIKTGYVVECVKIDEPKMRAYLYIKPEELPDGLRGADLQDYIDAAVELHAPHEEGQVDASHAHPDSRVGADAGKQQRLAHITLNETAAKFWARRQQEEAAAKAGRQAEEQKMNWCYKIKFKNIGNIYV